MFDGTYTNIIRAPEFPADFEWVNSNSPLSLIDLLGHIVVLDFWTYCCINCMHTLPVLAELEKKYEGKPVLFIGVHSAKFFNEQDKTNIEQAVRRYEISHPVLVDSQMTVWQKYNISGWPTIVIIDPKGHIVYKQSGEGQREMIEDTIDVLLDRYKIHLAKEPIKITYNKPADKALLSYPGKLSISNERIAISDSNHNRIIVADMKGKIQHIIGNGKKGFSDGSFSDASFFRPQGVVWKGSAIFVADTENHALRKIDLDAKNVITIAGTGRQGGWKSNGGIGVEVSLCSPWDVVVKDEMIFIAMAGNHQIWSHDLKTGNTIPFAGNGYENIVDGDRANAQLAQTSGLSLYDNRLYFADSETSSIREINFTTNQIRTIVGKGLFFFGYKDGNTGDALLQHPLGLHASSNQIFVADTYNSAIRMIDLDNNTVSTIIRKQDACGFDASHCNSLGLYEPGDVKLHDEKLYIADTNNHLIRIYDLKEHVLLNLNISA